MKKLAALVLSAAMLMGLGGCVKNVSTGGYDLLNEDNVVYAPVVQIATDLGYTVEDNGSDVVLSNGSWEVDVNADGTAKASYAEQPVSIPVLEKNGTLYTEIGAMAKYLSIGISQSTSGEVTAAVDPVGAARDAVRRNAYGLNETNEIETYEVMLPMDDGVKLRTVVIKPVGDGPFPTAFTRGPYPGQEPAKMALGEEYAKRGMAYVFQYCRGKGGSEGEYVANVDERRDGKTSLEWLNNEPWVESIGMHGHSYLALTTWIVSDILPEKVKALHVQSYGVLRNLSVSHSGLVAVDNICAWTLGNCTDKYSYDFYIESAQYLPQIKVDTDLWGTPVDGYADLVNHPDFTDAYWNEGVWGDLKNAIGKIDVPITIAVGYYDHHFEGTVEAWSMLSDETKAKSHMVLGPWNHGFQNAASWKGGENLDYDMNEDTFNWFYSILVNGKVPETGVDAYVVGSGEWKHLDSFPIENDTESVYYMTKNSTESDGTAYALETGKPAGQDTFNYVYDPSDPKWTEGGECMLYSSSDPDLRGSNPLSPAGYRDDVISFITEPVAEDTVLAGNLVADLFVSSDCDDTAFTFTISEVDPEGTAHNIRNGLLTMSYRHDRYASPVNDYKAGEIAEMKVESLPIVWNVAKGNRIRIDISSSDFPEFSNHTNTVGNWAEQTEYKVANQTIYVGGENASSVTLPILSN